jgi:hypothetical protein
MIQKSNAQLWKITLTNFFVCFTVWVWLIPLKSEASAQGPPAAFLGPIYYETNGITAVFDHNLPLLSIGGDDQNACTEHNDGAGCINNPPDGFGYDHHDGIDYGLDYEPVLAAANGIIDDAGWADPTDHRDGLGLRVKIEHANGYTTEYGHLSVLQVQTGDEIEVDADNRHGIIGISGNTGNVIGNNCDPDDDPTCGAHLHFGLIEPGGARVNPYGWDGLPVVDPWEQDIRGAASHDVWVEYPSITTAQFDDGDEIDDPGVNNARMIIDNNSTDFSTIGSCWATLNYYGSYNNSYRRAPSNGSQSCSAHWNIHADAFTPPGEYDVFAYMPDFSLDDVIATTTLSAVYEIHHNNEVSTAIVVQAGYVNNAEHDAWAYLGRYEFAMDDAIGEFIALDDAATGQTTPLTTFPDSLVYDAIWLVSPGQPPTLLTQSVIARHPAWLVEN